MARTDSPAALRGPALTFVDDPLQAGIEPAMRYEPARLDGRPVCQLLRNEVKFGWAGPMPMVTLFN